MTKPIYGDLLVKRVTDDNGSVYWLLFNSGELVHPIIVLTDAAAKAFAECVMTERED